MFWADRIANEIKDSRKPKNGSRFVIRDEKTLSGRVHVGSMRGVAIHGLVSEALAAQGIENEYRYELNDFDPFDGVPSYLDAATYEPYLGLPLYKVPSPEEGFANYAEYFGAEFVDVQRKAGFFPSYYRATELYQSGRMDPFIRMALERAADVRRILREVSGSEKDESWLPVSVVCENCGKIMTTRAYDFDGETVGYACDWNPDGAKACGHKGRVAPWKGATKLFWKVDWAAKWAVNGVDIEGAGKDHSTKGGSRDVAAHIAAELFDYENPFDVPYEFFLIGGKKMSSSKGRGSSAKDMSDLFPSEVFRLALIGKDINQQVDVDPEGESVPRLYDWYDELADGVSAGKEDDYAKLFTYCQLPDKRGGFAVPWQMRFREVAFVVQMPHLSLEAEAERAKGSTITQDEVDALNVRAQYARHWIRTYAPQEFLYQVQLTMPDVQLTEAQRKALGMLATFMEEGTKDGDVIHGKLHALKEEAPIAPKDLFQAIYAVFLGRTSGPKAGWFLAGLPREFVVARLAEAAR